MQRGVVQNTSELQQDSPIGDFNWATNFPGGAGDRSHSGHQACRWPLRDIASHVRILKTFTHSNIVPFWKTFVTRTMSTIFTSGLYSTFSNSTIMNKKSKWAILNKKQYYTIIQYYIFAYPARKKNGTHFINWAAPQAAHLTNGSSLYHIVWKISVHSRCNLIVNVNYSVRDNLRADVCKCRPAVRKIKFLKNPPKIM